MAENASDQTSPVSDDSGSGPETTAPTPVIEVTDTETPDLHTSEPQSPAPSRSPSTAPTTPISATSPHPSLTPETSAYSEDVADDECPPGQASVLSRSGGSSTLGGDTVTPSAPTSRPTSTPPRSPSPRRDTDSIADDEEVPRWRRWIPGSITTQNIFAVGVVVLTIITLDYSHRGDVASRWNNKAEFFEYCNDINFNEAACMKIRNSTLGLPPYVQFSDLFQKAQKRALRAFATQQPERRLTLTQRALAVKIPLPVLAVLLFAALVIYLYVKYRRSLRMRLSDLSMARSQPTASQSAIGTDNNALYSGGVKRRYRAFVSAEQAIRQMKRANSSYNLPHDESRRSSQESNRWTRRRSRLANSDPSIFDSAHVYLHDPDHEHEENRWQKVKPYASSVSTFQSTAETLRSRKSGQKESPSPPPTPPQAPESSQTPKEIPFVLDDKEHPHVTKLKRWVSPKPIRVYQQPALDLGEGDFDAAVAYIGASVAAFTGGHAMSRCPIEIPFDSDGNLPDGWLVAHGQHSSGE